MYVYILLIHRVISRSNNYPLTQDDVHGHQPPSASLTTPVILDILVPGSHIFQRCSSCLSTDDARSILAPGEICQGTDPADDTITIPACKSARDGQNPGFACPRDAVTSEVNSTCPSSFCHFTSTRAKCCPSRSFSDWQPRRRVHAICLSVVPSPLSHHCQSAESRWTTAIGAYVRKEIVAASLLGSERVRRGADRAILGRPSERGGGVSGLSH